MQKVKKDRRLEPKPLRLRPKRKVPKPYTIECRFRRWCSDDVTAWNDWHLDGRYASERVRNEALEVKLRYAEHHKFIEYRSGCP